MAKAVKVLCDRCESKIVAGTSFCGRCGFPTRWASHEERTGWEVAQWKTADRAHASSPAESVRDSRRWTLRPFGRRAADKSPLTLASEPEERRTPVTSSVAVATRPPATESRAVAAAPAAAPRPSMKPLVRPAIRPAPRDDEPAHDTPATVMAMRLLNARVAELEDRLRQVERELSEARATIELP